MKIEILEQTVIAESVEERTTTLEVFPTNLPNGITTDIITAAGQLIVSSGPATPAVLDTASANDGDVLQKDSSQAVKMKFGPLGAVADASLTNKSGATRSIGDVVIQDTSSDSAYTTTTTEGAMVIGVVNESTANNAVGKVKQFGVMTVNVQGNVSRGNYLIASTTAGRAKGTTDPANAFGVALTQYTGGAAGSVTALVIVKATKPTIYNSIEVVLGSGDSVITTGLKGFYEVGAAQIIESATLLADVSGSIVVDIWKNTYANFPPTSANSICASAKPTLSSAQKSQNATLTGWTTSLAKGDILAFNVDSAATVKQVTLSLKTRLV
jgi:hypothetical protein